MSAETHNVGRTDAHLAYLDGLRALAALQVIMGHAVGQVDWSFTAGAAVAVLTWPFAFAREAVALFIVLSGFCLMLPVVRHGGRLQGGALGFLQRRARRILPPYFFALGLSLLLVWTLIGRQTGTLWDKSLPADTKAIWTHLLLVQDCFKDTSARINHALWSISVEWRLYFLFPLLVLAWRRLGPVLTALAVVLGSCLLARGLNLDWLNTGTYGICPQFLGLFALGVLGASLAYAEAPHLVALRSALPWGLITAGLLALVMALKHLKLWHGALMPTYLRDYLVGLFAMSLIVSAAVRRTSAIYRVLSWKPLVFVGSFSYSLYLMHAPCLQVLWQYGLSPLGLPPVLAFPLLLVLGTPVVVLLCYGFFLCFERPFLSTPAQAIPWTREAITKSTTLAEIAAPKPSV